MSASLLRWKIQRHVTDHNTLREIRLSDDNGTHLLENLNKHGIVFGWSKGSAHISQSRVDAFNVELIFQRDRDSMQWSSELSGIFKLGI